MLFFVLFSFKVEIPFFTARILEILNLCFGEKPINSKADRTAAILFSYSGNKNSNEFFFFLALNLPSSRHPLYVPQAA